MKMNLILKENETACRARFHMKVLALRLFSNRGTSELGNGLLPKGDYKEAFLMDMKSQTQSI